MSGLFSLSEHDRWKIEGEGKHSRLRRQLWNLGEHTATNLGFAGVQWCTVGSQGGTLLCFRRRGNERMRENGSEWSWRAVKYCSHLLAVMNRPSEHTGEIGPRWAPSLLFFICQVCSPHVETTGNTHIPVEAPAGLKIVCMHGTHSYIHTVKKPKSMTRWSPFIPLCHCSVVYPAHPHMQLRCPYASLVLL